MLPEPTVFLVDDDPSVLKSLRWLIQSVALRVETYTSAEQFLGAYDPTRPGCLVLDVRMPKMSGLELQATLSAMSAQLPIIVMTGHGDISMCASVFRKGGFDFLEKPADDGLLLDRIQAAIESDAQARSRIALRDQFNAKLAKLTPREREVFNLLVSGTTLKQIATALAISAQTAAKHRARVHGKIKVQTDAELASLASELSISQR